MTTIRRALWSHVQKTRLLCSELSKSYEKGVGFSLAITTSNYCSIFSQFQWITYEVYHLVNPNLCIALEDL